MKRRYLKVALRSDHYNALCVRADQKGITLSELVREQLGLEDEKNSVERALEQIIEKLSLPPAPAAIPVEAEWTLMEILLLMRELAADRNAQIVARVAQQMTRQRGGQHHGS